MKKIIFVLFVVAAFSAGAQNATLADHTVKWGKGQSLLLTDQRMAPDQDYYVLEGADGKDRVRLAVTMYGAQSLVFFDFPSVLKGCSFYMNGKPGLTSLMDTLVKFGIFGTTEIYSEKLEVFAKAHGTTLHTIAAGPAVPPSNTKTVYFGYGAEPPDLSKTEGSDVWKAKIRNASTQTVWIRKQSPRSGARWAEFRMLPRTERTEEIFPGEEFCLLGDKGQTVTCTPVSQQGTLLTVSKDLKKLE